MAQPARVSRAKHVRRSLSGSESEDGLVVSVLAFRELRLGKPAHFIKVSTGDDEEPRRRSMSVTFIRTGERRYAVRADIDGGQTVQMDQAPGYDPAMPHDLQHFIVEKCLGIEGGIFGRLAAGGTAKTFHATVDSGSAREASRIRRKQAARDKKILPVADRRLRALRTCDLCLLAGLASACGRSRRCARARSKMRQGAMRCWPG